MKIIKIFNNNIVATITDDKTEMIVTGSGIGFHKKIGDHVDEQRIEKNYVFDNSQRSRYYQLFQNTPLEYVEIAEAIYYKATDTLVKGVSSHMIISLTDHIAFAIEREKKNIKIPNLLLSEIQMMYQKEYTIGLWAIDYIDQMTQVHLPSDEAGYIAMHLVNASIGDHLGMAGEILRLSKGVISIINSNFSCKVDPDSISFTRLTTHLKYLAQRILNQSSQEIAMKDDERMYQLLLEGHSEMANCLDQIKLFIKTNFDYNLSQQECLYVMIHIIRILN